jgi:hypothetical protein
MKSASRDRMDVRKKGYKNEETTTCATESNIVDYAVEPTILTLHNCFNSKTSDPTDIRPCTVLTVVDSEVISKEKHHQGIVVVASSTTLENMPRPIFGTVSLEKRFTVSTVQ